MSYTTSHTQYKNTEGTEVPSVTTILKILNKPFLVKWANIMGFKRRNVDQILKETGILGTLVHALIDAYITNNKDAPIPTISNEYKEKARPYFKNFIAWYNTHTVEAILTEAKLESEKYGGTVDFYGKVDDKFTILDFKTSKRCYSSMFLQLAAYCILLEELGHVVEQVAIININETKYMERFMTREELNPYIETFKKLLDLFHTWYDLNKSEGWGDILG